MNHSTVLPEENTPSDEKPKQAPRLIDALEDLSCRSSEVEAILDLLIQYGEYERGATGQAVCAAYRLEQSLGEAIEAVIVLYKKGGAA
ncbi:MAG: hypothetical protein RI964_2512 [Pseudomonadota bacterium]|jgi:hypothetical protein